MKFTLQDRRRFPILFGAGCYAVLGLSFLVAPAERLAVIVTMLTAIGGMTGFLYANHRQEIELFRELFREFNNRYDELNERLNEIYDRPEHEQLKPGDHGVLCDYFNLCAEEQMYARAGCIDSDVWRAWENGMRHFAQDREIRKYWEQELKQDSYYGFAIPPLINPLTMEPSGALAA